MRWRVLGTVVNSERGLLSDIGVDVCIPALGWKSIFKKIGHLTINEAAIREDERIPLDDFLGPEDSEIQRTGGEPYQNLLPALWPLLKEHNHHAYASERVFAKLLQEPDEIEVATEWWHALLSESDGSHSSGPASEVDEAEPEEPWDRTLVECYQGFNHVCDKILGIAPP